MSNQVVVIEKAYTIHPYFVTRYNRDKFPFILEYEGGETAVIIKAFNPQKLTMHAPICRKDDFLDNDSPFYFHDCNAAFADWFYDYLSCWSDHASQQALLPITIADTIEELNLIERPSTSLAAWCDPAREKQECIEIYESQPF